MANEIIDTPEYQAYMKVWLETHKDKKGCYFSFQRHRSQQDKDFFSDEELYDREDTVEYVSFGIIDGPDGFFVRTYTIQQGRLIRKEDSSVGMKHTALDRLHVMATKQALGKS